jgi:hypothetical protein
MTRLVATLLTSAMVVLIPRVTDAQQRPLVTEDPETIGAGRILFEGGVDLAHDQPYPVSGLEGNLLRLPTIGLSFGLSSIAELQIDGGLYDHLAITARHAAPLSSLVTATGDSTHDIEDTIIATKIRVLSETDGRPALGVRFATKLPNASNESGLGLDTTDFYMSLLVAKTVQSIRVVGNVGVGILADPTSGNRQNDVLTYGLSFARAVTQSAEFVGEVNGRASTRSSDDPIPGTESRSLLRLGGRYTHGMLRVDGGVYVGLTTADPNVGVTFGFTYVINAFKVP